MAIMIIASKISHWPVFLDISERWLATPDLYNYGHYKDKAVWAKLQPEPDNDQG